MDFGYLLLHRIVSPPHAAIAVAKTFVGFEDLSLSFDSAVPSSHSVQHKGGDSNASENEKEFEQSVVVNAMPGQDASVIFRDCIQHHCHLFDTMSEAASLFGQLRWNLSDVAQQLWLHDS